MNDTDTAPLLAAAPAPASLPPVWERAPQSLLFWISYWRLWSAGFRGYVCTSHCLEHTGVSLDPEPYISALPPDCDAAVVREIVVDRDIRLPRLSFSRHGIRYVPLQFDRCFVDLSGTFEQYMQKFSAKSRKNLNRSVRALEAHSGGKLDFRVYRTPAEIAEFYSLALPLSQKTYQAQLMQDGLNPNPAFREQLIERAARDAVRGYLLFCEGSPIAFVYGWVNGGALIYQTVGYDTDFAKRSPGTVLDCLVIEELFRERRFRVLDFFEGMFAYKTYFATRIERCCRVYFFRRNFRNAARVLAHAGFNAFTTRLFRILERAGLKDRLKKWIRRAVAGEWA